MISWSKSIQMTDQSYYTKHQVKSDGMLVIVLSYQEDKFDTDGLYKRVHFTSLDNTWTTFTCDMRRYSWRFPTETVVVSATEAMNMMVRLFANKGMGPQIADAMRTGWKFR